MNIYNYTTCTDQKNKEDIIQQIKETKVMFNNRKQLVCLNNLSLEIKYKLIKCCIWSVALYRSETRTIGEKEGRVVNAFETWCRKRMLKIQWTDRITNDMFFKGRKK
jgi:hypothetical protein